MLSPLVSCLMARLFVFPTRKVLAWIKFCWSKSEEKVEKTLGKTKLKRTSHYETFRY